MSNFEFRNDKVYKKGSSNQLGYVRGDKIYPKTYSNQIGYIRGDKIYPKTSSNSLSTTVKDIIKDFKGSDKLKDVMIAAAYHFLCKNIF